MKQYESEHYIFHYGEGTRAEADIAYIVAEQEACFAHICRVLEVRPSFKLNYYLCDSSEEVGRIYGDNEPCSGFAVMPDTIYAVYNEQLQCIGFHEDAHIISYTINIPDCPALREGLAMYFDRKWWGIQNLDWCGLFLQTDRFVPVEKLLDEACFLALGCEITYPIMGAFTDYLLSTYGRERYLELYRRQDTAMGMVQVYGKTPEKLGAEFVSYVKLFPIDEVLKKRMEELLEQ